MHEESSMELFEETLPQLSLADSIRQDMLSSKKLVKPPGNRQMKSQGDTLRHVQRRTMYASSCIGKNGHTRKNIDKHLETKGNFFIGCAPVANSRHQKQKTTVFPFLATVRDDQSSMAEDGQWRRITFQCTKTMKLSRKDERDEQIEQRKHTHKKNKKQLQAYVISGTTTATSISSNNRQFPSSHISGSNKTRNSSTGQPSHMAVLENNLRMIQSSRQPSSADELCQVYIRKCGLPSNPIFIVNSQDDHIRRVLVHWQWNENKIMDSPFYHLKWLYKDSPHDYSKLVPGQYLNHFKNNQQMTAKGRLLINLRNSQFVTETSYTEYFPRCYDLGNNNDLEQFMEDYQRTTMLILLRKLYCHAKNCQPSFDKLQKQVLDRVERKRKGWHVRKKSIKSPGHGSFRLMQFEDYLHKRDSFLIQMNLSMQIIKYVRHILKKGQLDWKAKPTHILHFNRQSFQADWPQLQQLLRMNLPYKPSMMPNMTAQFFATPSRLFLQKLVKYYWKCWKKFGGEKWSAEGLQNIWIIKPANNARGSGIHLCRQQSEVLTSGQGLSSRIVQKYIEKPLIFKNQTFGFISGRKFDIRQWVLVTRFQPLQIYRFSTCYLRVCSDTYDLSRPDILSGHLTNYSFNKNKFKNKQQSVISLQRFQEMLYLQKQVRWSDVIEPQIDKIVREVVQRCSDGIQSHPSSFELFGFDLLIDQNFRLWLLEVNMSPACQQRCDFLKQYCQVMAQGLLRLVLPENLKKPASYPALHPNYHKHCWLKIYSQQQFQVNQEVQLQPIVTAVNWKRQLAMCRRERQDEAALTIQTLWKMIKSQREFRRLKQLKYTGIINRYLLSFRQTMILKKHQQSDSTNKIQSYFKTIKAVTLLRRLKYSESIISIDRYLRAIPAIKQMDRLKLNRAIMTIQVLYQHRLNLDNIQHRLTSLEKIKKLQLKVKEWYGKRNQAARVIQKAMKNYVYRLRKQRFQKQLSRLHHSKIIQRYVRGRLDSRQHGSLVRQYFKEIICSFLKCVNQQLTLKRKCLGKMVSVLEKLKKNTQKLSRRRAFDRTVRYGEKREYYQLRMRIQLRQLLFCRNWHEKLRKFTIKNIHTYLKTVAVYAQFEQIKQKQLNKPQQFLLNFVDSSQAIETQPTIYEEKPMIQRRRYDNPMAYTSLTEYKLPERRSQGSVVSRSSKNFQNYLTNLTRSNGHTSVPKKKKMVMKKREH